MVDVVAPPLPAVMCLFPAKSCVLTFALVFSSLPIISRKDLFRHSICVGQGVSSEYEIKKQKR